MVDVRVIDSDTRGDPAAFVTLERLEAARAVLARGPALLRAVVRRGPGGRRELLEVAELSRARGLAGDAWERGRAHPDMQLAMMDHAVAGLIANGQPLALFGDNLFVDLDVSASALPPGTRLRLGSAVLEVTAEPHNGCSKFRSRFGPDALRFVALPRLRACNHRGIYLRVVQDGTARVGERIAPVVTGAAG